jgi:phospholipid/cholesterol/gamma-HCH transport system substrate-binding protein
MQEEKPPTTPPPVAHVEFKAALLLVLLIVLVSGAVLYVLYARGAFEATQRLVLIAEDSEGVRVGMDLTFSGFPIGRVRRIELAQDGTARILVDVPRKDAHWLRTSSVFTLVRNLLGGTNLRAYTGIPTDPPLPDGAERRVLIGDATAEIPKLVAAARDLVQNLTVLSAADSPLSHSIANLEEVSAKLKGPGGALEVVLGKDAKKLVATLDRTNALLARIDGLAAKTDAQVFGDQGLMSETRATVAQLNATLSDARSTLQKMDALLTEAQAIAGNTRAATTDLDVLRNEVDATLRKVEGLVDEINRKWPFARDTELKLP